MGYADTHGIPIRSCVLGMGLCASNRYSQHLFRFKPIHFRRTMWADSMGGLPVAAGVARWCSLNGDD